MWWLVGQRTAPGGGGACSIGTPARCDGTALVSCEGGFESRIDCATKLASGTCIASTATSTPAYCGSASECYPTRASETCSGTSLSFCAGGVPTTVDCTNLGFSTCMFRACLP